MNKPLGIIFDLGDTVIEYEKSDPIEGTRRILEISNNPRGITAEEIQKLAINLTKDVFDNRDRASLEVSFQSFQRLLYEHFDITFNKDLEEIEKLFIKHAFKGKPSAGINELFHILEKYRIKYCALSNSSFTGKTLKYELEEYGLYPNFKFIMSSCDYCLRKPNKKLFDLASYKLGIEPQNIWVIGDSYDYDIKGANNSGMYPVWLNKRDRKNVGNIDLLEVKSIEKITKIIDVVYRLSDI